LAAAGLKPYDHVIRGGTELGLPTANLFCGEHNTHGSLEWVAVQDMESAAAGES
jgi:di/tripeptidase